MSGTTPEDGGAPDAKLSYLYVAFDGNSQNAQVDVLRRNHLADGIVRKISKRIQYPDGLFVDPSDTLYVANAIDSGGHDTVTVYRSGADKPFRTYRGFCYAADAVEGNDGTVYIADLCGTTRRSSDARRNVCIDNGAVHVYAENSTKQIRILHFKGGPYSVTLDNKNNLYVGYENACSDKGQVRRYAPGAMNGVDLLPPKAIFSVGGIAIDKRGNLLVVDAIHGAVDVFSGEHKPPSRVISTGQTYSDRLTFDRLENRLYVTFQYLPDQHPRKHGGDARGGVKRPNTVVVIDYSSGKLLYTLKNLVPGWVPSGVAAYPPAPFGAPF